MASGDGFPWIGCILIVLMILGFVWIVEHAAVLFTGH